MSSEKSPKESSSPSTSKTSPTSDKEPVKQESDKSPKVESDKSSKETDKTSKLAKLRGIKTVIEVSTLTRWSQTTATLRDTDEGATSPESASSSSSVSSSVSSSSSSASSSVSSSEDPMAFLHNIDLTLAKEKETKVKEEEDKKKKEKEEKEKPLFPKSKTLNKKLVLWQGDLISLDIDCIVNTTNERLTDKNGISGRIFHYGGTELVQECQATEGCPTGDAIISKGHSLLARHIIHTVGPRYSVKYQTAAENALHGCYRRALELLKDHHLTEIAFPVINTDRKGYPKKQAAHVAIRTIRRFLEKWGDTIDTVILVVDNSNDFQIYQATLPLYFPRDENEEKAALKLLPKEIGNELGEKVLPERRIRIDAGFLSPPKPLTEEEQKAIKDDDLRVHSVDTHTVEGAFHEMQDNPDDVRRKQELARPKAELEKENEDRRYLSYVRRAQDEDLKDMAALNFIYQSGVDQLGRPIIVFVISQLPADSPKNLERVLLYTIKVLDPLVDKDYNVIYFHAGLREANKPPFTWLKEVYGIFNRKYKKNMKRLFIVHPNFWVKLVLWFAQPFVKKKFWRKVSYVQRLFDLYEFFDPKTLLIPEPIIKYDRDLFGQEYEKQLDFKEKSKREDDQL